MKTNHGLAWLGMLVCFVVVGCGKKTVAPQVYDIKGKVVAINLKKKSVTLEHDAMPGLMEAKKRKFDIESEQFLEGLKVRDLVQGQLQVTPGVYMITALHKR